MPVNSLEIVGGDLLADYDPMLINSLYIDDSGDLIANVKEGDNMAKVNVGKVVPTVTIGSNGNWYIDGVDTTKPSRGAQGAQGPAGRDGSQGPAGPAGRDGSQGPAGPAGVNGKTPVQTFTIEGNNLYVDTTYIDGEPE